MYEFTFNDAAAVTGPGSRSPNTVKFSPDGKFCTYLWGNPQELRYYELASHQQGVFFSAMDVVADVSEQAMSLEEQLRRERMRQMGTGVTSYAFAKDGAVMVPLMGDIFVRDSLHGKIAQVTPAGHAAIDPQWSPDGSMICWVHENELWVASRASGAWEAPKQLTFGAAERSVTHGLAEFVAQEEMDRFTGYWWSPDSQRIAYAEVDENHIPIYNIVHHGEALVQESHRYPFTGAANAKVRLGVVEISSATTLRWLDIGHEDSYLARVNFLRDGALIAQIQNRLQNVLELYRFEVDLATRSLLHREESATFINLHDMFHPLRDNGFLWASEESGFMHIYRHDARGQRMVTLTSGEWLVNDICAIDEDKGFVYFVSTCAGWTERHLCRVSLVGGDIEILTKGVGVHAVVVNAAANVYTDTFSSLTTPLVLVLRDLATGAEIQQLFNGRRSEDEHIISSMTIPTLETFSSRDGTILQAAVYRPDAAKYGPGPYPTVISVYGGPHVQTVTNSWAVTAQMRAQLLVSRGFLVAKIDNRGSSNRGVAFESAIHRRMGTIEVDDQADGVAYLVKAGLTLVDRVGIYGWSYGGYMSAMSLCRAPHTFRVAVAGAPVTAWDGYDTHYTERYMHSPELNPKGYRDGAVMSHVENMAGKLMLVHGLIDENVHFRHTARLITALIEARKTYELLIFPAERHAPRRAADRVYMESRIYEFIQQHLTHG